MPDFDDIDIAQLRRRKSEKWTTFPPDVLPAFVAEMDFMLAPPIRRTLIDAVELGDCGYAGIADVAPAFCEFVENRFEWLIDASQIIGLPDVMAGVTEALQSLTAPGAGVVINPPVYPPFFEVIRSSGRTVVEVPLVAGEDGWDLDLHALEAAFAAGARAYLLCSPHNPVGRVWPEHVLRGIAQLARTYDVTVIADEIHAPLTMPGFEFTPFLAVAGEIRAIALASASKAWNVPGLKCAVAVAGSQEVLRALDERMKISPSDVRWRIGHFGSLATSAAFRNGIAWLDELRAHLDRNRLLLADLLAEHVPGARYRAPEATYLAWIDCSNADAGENPARAFLDGGRVALEPGVRFGTGGANHVRLNFATSRDLLREMVVRMGKAIRARM